MRAILITLVFITPLLQRVARQSRRRNITTPEEFRRYARPASERAAGIYQVKPTDALRDSPTDRLRRARIIYVVQQLASFHLLIFQHLPQIQHGTRRRSRALEFREGLRVVRFTSHPSMTCVIVSRLSARCMS
jgi:hypothetical protein